MVPISYSPRTGSLAQHHHNLRTYKSGSASSQTRLRLLAVLLLFMRDHLTCIAAKVGAMPDCVAAVPSTRGRPGPHPLVTLIGSQLGLPWISVGANAAYGAGDRDFHPDWFVPDLSDTNPSHALVIDDTWTTGSRAQSLAYALKTEGVPMVSTVVLGRHIDPEYPPSARLLAAIQTPLFDTSRCAAED